MVTQPEGAATCDAKHMKILTYVSCRGTQHTDTTVLKSECLQLYRLGPWTDVCDCIRATLRTTSLQPDYAMSPE